MTKRFSTLACLCAAVLFAACGGRQSHDHDHDHEGDEAEETTKAAAEETTSAEAEEATE